MNEEQKLKLARGFFKGVLDSLEFIDDAIYEDIDPDCKFSDDELCNEFNLDTIKEVIRLGFVAKYGKCL